MQLITIISAATAMVAGVSARSAVELTSSCDKSQAYAKVINRCNYPVYLWSVFRGNGCPSDGMVTLKKGESYYENLAEPENDVGVSIKISKKTTCKPNDIVQLEYFLEKKRPDYIGNYLDVSYVDCLGNDCPTKSEGYYLKSGTQTGGAKASASNTWCPILSCHDADSCAKMSYILPDDVQTKTCNLTENMEFYMCGGEGPDGGYGDNDNSPTYESATPSKLTSLPSYATPSKSAALPSYAASSSIAKSSSTFIAVVSSASKPASTKTAVPSSTSTYGDSYDEEDTYESKAPAVTSVPVASPQSSGSSRNVKTQVVYVTAYEYTHAKRHDHARRHQQFHA